MMCPQIKTTPLWNSYQLLAKLATRFTSDANNHGVFGSILLWLSICNVMLLDCWVDSLLAVN